MAMKRRTNKPPPKNLQRNQLQAAIGKALPSASLATAHLTEPINTSFPRIEVKRGKSLFSIVDLPRLAANDGGGKQSGGNKRLCQDAPDGAKLWAWFYNNQPSWGVKSINTRLKGWGCYKATKKYDDTWLNIPDIIPPSPMVGYRYRASHNFFEKSTSPRSLSLGGVKGIGEDEINALTKWHQDSEFMADLTLGGVLLLSTDGDRMAMIGLTSYLSRLRKRSTGLSTKECTEPEVTGPWYGYNDAENYRKVDTSGLPYYDELFMGPQLPPFYGEVQRQRHLRNRLGQLKHFRGAVVGLTTYLLRLKKGPKRTPLPYPESLYKYYREELRLDEEDARIRAIKPIKEQDYKPEPSGIIAMRGDNRWSFMHSFEGDERPYYNLWLKQRDCHNKGREYQDLKSLRNVVAFRHFTIYLNRLKSKMFELNVHQQIDREPERVDSTYPGEYLFRDKFLDLGEKIEGRVAHHKITGHGFICRNGQWESYSICDSPPHHLYDSEEEVEARWLSKKIAAEYLKSTKAYDSVSLGNHKAFRDPLSYDNSGRKTTNTSPSMKNVSTDPPREDIKLILPQQSITSELDLEYMQFIAKKGFNVDLIRNKHYFNEQSCTCPTCGKVDRTGLLA